MPEFENEVKKRVNMTLTPTAIRGLDALASERGLSRSELVEQIGKGNFIIVDINDVFETEINFQTALLPSIETLPIERCHELPKVAGVYVVVGKQGAILTGYTESLHDEFRRNIRKVYDFFSKMNTDEQYAIRPTPYLIFWIRGSDKILLNQLKSLIINTVQKLVVEETLQDFFKIT